jgi:hypothetical protein
VSSDVVRGDLRSPRTSSEQCTHLAAQRYATQAGFKGWPPNAVATIFTPDDGHADARNMLSQKNSYIIASIWFSTLHNGCNELY